LVGPVWGAYGGHYFSATQALTFDYMMSCLPVTEPGRTVCQAATIYAASRCAAAPGHTAQPFQPTPTASRYILEAWDREPIAVARQALNDICPRHARVVGEVLVSDALDVARTLRSDDLVVVDPPYSSVQYSRFYHVLETIAGRSSATFAGVGRYPPIEDRPQSDFSKRTRSRTALSALFEALAQTGATVILTFPAAECSNGLSGGLIIEMAEQWYDVRQSRVSGRFSTLGGNNGHRASRASSEELLLFMAPKSPE
jgi:hypothetical protein